MCEVSAEGGAASARCQWSVTGREGDPCEVSVKCQWNGGPYRMSANCQWSATTLREQEALAALFRKDDDLETWADDAMFTREPIVVEQRLRLALASGYTVALLFSCLRQGSTSSP